MFEETACYYDKICAFKDYAAEARTLIDIVEGELGDARGRLLDVACGTGRHLELLRTSFEVEGLDLSPELLEVARDRLPDVLFHCADMRDFRIPSRFDVIVCLFSSIGYMTTLDDVVRAVRTMADHLGSGGLVIAAALLERVIEAARAEDVLLASLHATRIGRGIYERAGFEIDGNLPEMRVQVKQRAYGLSGFRSE